MKTIVIVVLMAVFSHSTYVLAHHSEADTQIAKRVPPMIAAAESAAISAAKKYADTKIAEIAMNNPVRYEVYYMCNPQSCNVTTVKSDVPITVPNEGDYAFYKISDGTWIQGKVDKLYYFTDQDFGTGQTVVKTWVQIDRASARRARDIDEMERQMRDWSK